MSNEIYLYITFRAFNSSFFYRFQCIQQNGMTFLNVNIVYATLVQGANFPDAKTALTTAVQREIWTCQIKQKEITVSSITKVKQDSDRRHIKSASASSTCTNIFE